LARAVAGDDFVAVSRLVHGQLGTGWRG
jgi:mannose/fructose/N-acetylgalactosamine-specific phosphotransferase system component IIB